MIDYSVRLVIKKEGLDLLTKELEKVDNESFKNIFDKADIKKSIGDLVYLGWNKLNSESYIFIQHRIFEVGYNDISYRMTGIGEDLTDIQEEHYTSSIDKDMDIPFPSVIRTFDDIDMEQQLNSCLKTMNITKEVESIEYE